MKRSQILEEISSYLARNGAKRVSVFGSYARGEETASSDVDVLVEFSQGKSLLELVGLEQELSKRLSVKVELLTEAAISPYIIDRIKKEAKVIHA